MGWVTLASVALAPGCQALEEELDTYERSLVAQFRIGDPPPSPSNAVADDPGAVALGHRLFFDPRMSGPLGPDNDLVTRGRLGPSGATGRVSCAACHDLKNGGADRRSEPSASSLGVSRPTLPRGTSGTGAPTRCGRRRSLRSKLQRPTEEIGSRSRT
jgi:cytochrome c peroxidase